MTKEEALRRYPRLIAHMIAESLGYFSVASAASALAAYTNGKPYSCEWYGSMCKSYFNDEELIDVGRKTVEHAFRSRHYHRGYMASYQQARVLVMAELGKPGITGSMLASWF